MYNTYIILHDFSYCAHTVCFITSIFFTLFFGFYTEFGVDFQVDFKSTRAAPSRKSTW